MAGLTYLCEAGGARILRAGIGLTQVGGGYEAELDTWDLAALGITGDNMFRAIMMAGRMTNGYSIGVTPVVDGLPLVEQLFGGAGSGEWQAVAFFMARGTRLAANLRTLSRAGDIEFHDIQAAYVPLRKIP